MSGVSLSDEYLLAHEALGCTTAELDRLVLAGFEHAFLPWPMRSELLARATAQLASLS
jgi:adenosine deaminase